MALNGLKFSFEQIGNKSKMKVYESRQTVFTGATMKSEYKTATETGGITR